MTDRTKGHDSESSNEQKIRDDVQEKIDTVVKRTVTSILHPQAQQVPEQPVKCKVIHMNKKESNKKEANKKEANKKEPELPRSGLELRRLIVSGIRKYLDTYIDKYIHAYLKAHLKIDMSYGRSNELIIEVRLGYDVIASASNEIKVPQ